MLATNPSISDHVVGTRDCNGRFGHGSPIGACRAGENHISPCSPPLDAFLCARINGLCAICFLDRLDEACDIIVKTAVDARFYWAWTLAHILHFTPLSRGFDKPQGPKGPGGVLSPLNMAISALNRTNEATSVTPAKGAFTFAGVLPTTIAVSFLEATEKLTTRVESAMGTLGDFLTGLSIGIVDEIQRRIIKRGKRNAISRPSPHEG